MSNEGRRQPPQHIIRHEKIQPEKERFLPKHFETELRAWVSHKIASTNIKPSDVVEKLREVAKSWELVNLEVRFFDETE